MAKEKSKLKDLWMLLFEDPMNLDDAQITQLLKVKEELMELIYRAWRRFPDNLERVQNYRARKKELSELATEKLMEMKQEIIRERTAYLASRDEKEIGDSFFEALPIDTDERIITEILKEKDVTK